MAILTTACGIKDQGLGDRRLKVNGISSLIDSLVKHSAKITAVSAGIMSPNIQFSTHHGMLLNGTKPSDQTLYEIASITKTFAGLLLAHAILEKGVDLDEDVRSYLPDGFDNLEVQGRAITFRDLATHRSGLPLLFPHEEKLYQYEPDWNVLPFELNRLQQNFSKEAFFAELQRYKLTDVPGSNTLYSNAGTNLVGYILEHIYDQSFLNLLREKIFEPLQMHSATMLDDGVEIRKIATGLNEHGLEMPLRVEKQMSAEGGIIANVTDMMKYMEYHINATSEVVEFAHIRLQHEKDAYHQGLYWQFEDSKNGPPRLTQLGGAYGTSSIMTIIPRSGVGVFMVTNVAGSGIHLKLEAAVNEIVRILD